MTYELDKWEEIEVELTIDGAFYQIFSRYDGFKGVLCNGELMRFEFGYWHDNADSPSDVVRELKQHLKEESKREYDQKQLNLNLDIGA